MGVSISTEPNRVDIYQQDGFSGGGSCSCGDAKFDSNPNLLDPRMAPYVTPEDYTQTLEKINKVLVKRAPRRFCLVLVPFSLLILGVVVTAVSRVQIHRLKHWSPHQERSVYCIAPNGTCAWDQTPENDHCCEYTCCPHEDHRHGSPHHRGPKHWGRDRPHAVPGNHTVPQLEPDAKLCHDLAMPLNELLGWDITCSHWGMLYSVETTARGCRAEEIAKTPACAGNAACLAGFKREQFGMMRRCPATCGSCGRTSTCECTDMRWPLRGFPLPEEVQSLTCEQWALSIGPEVREVGCRGEAIAKLPGCLNSTECRKGFRMAPDIMRQRCPVMCGVDCTRSDPRGKYFCETKAPLPMQAQLDEPLIEPIEPRRLHGKGGKGGKGRGDRFGQASQEVDQDDDEDKDGQEPQDEEEPEDEELGDPDDMESDGMVTDGEDQPTPHGRGRHRRDGSGRRHDERSFEWGSCTRVPPSLTQQCQTSTGAAGHLQILGEHKSVMDDQVGTRFLKVLRLLRLFRVVMVGAFVWLVVGLLCVHRRRSALRQHVLSTLAHWIERGLVVNYFQGTKHMQARITVHVPMGTPDTVSTPRAPLTLAPRPSPSSAESSSSPLLAQTTVTQPPAPKPAVQLGSTLRTVQVRVPQDATPGARVGFVTPEGLEMQITVPQGHQPGAQLTAEYDV